ncbi:ABC-three component system protein [Bradyrhizobium diazoefficiens]
MKPLDSVFAFLIEEIQKKRVALKGKRRMISVMLHYMYANCDIGSKKLPTTPMTDNAHA